MKVYLSRKGRQDDVHPRDSDLDSAELQLCKQKQEAGNSCSVGKVLKSRAIGVLSIESTVFWDGKHGGDFAAQFYTVYTRP